MTFSIDEAVLAGYRRRADNARSALKNCYDASRALRGERDELLATASRQQMVAEASARRTSSDPVDFLHDEDKARLKRITADIDRAAADERAAESELDRVNATATRVIDFAKTTRAAAETAAFAEKLAGKPQPPTPFAPVATRL